MPRTRHELDIEGLSTLELAAGRPKGHQLRGILAEIAAKVGPGALMPSERVLAEYFDVSRTTVRQEIERMVADGLLFRRHGHGTLVAQPRPAYTDLLTSFTQDMRGRGLRAGARTLSSVVEPASAETAAKLEVPPESKVFWLDRLRLADDEPLAIERTLVSELRFPGLAELDWTDRSLFDTVQERWGVQPADSEALISSVLPTEEQTRLLGISAQQPCLQVNGVTRDAQGGVLEISRSLYRGDRYEVLARVRR